jgi:hypothetical protein
VIFKRLVMMRPWDERGFAETKYHVVKRFAAVAASQH